MRHIFRLLQQYEGGLSQAEAEEAALVCLRAHVVAYRARQRGTAAGRAQA